MFSLEKKIKLRNYKCEIVNSPLELIFIISSLAKANHKNRIQLENISDKVAHHKEEKI